MSKANVVNFNNVNKKNSINLSDYKTKKMFCPVRSKNEQCYYIPLNEVNDVTHNPARAKGTDEAKVNQIFDSLITAPEGQEEPICLEWNPATAEWDKVFGYNRAWATSKAYKKGYSIQNHPKDRSPGIWAWVFTGSPPERTTLQLRENANKKPSSPATKDEVVVLLAKYIAQGGLSTGAYKKAFTSLDDDAKYKRAKEYMKQTAPFWGGRRFIGVWNKLTQDGKSSVGLSYKTWSKDRLAKYYCAHNKLGIKMEDLDDKLSGSVVEKGTTKYGIYFVTQRAEIGGALPTNVCKKKVKEKVDKIILICALNDATVGSVDGVRKTFVTNATWWNNNIFDVFDEVCWMPQTKKETDAHLFKGEWVGVHTF
jgi:hypothetical protein